jgi:hypothetical protein
MQLNPSYSIFYLVLTFDWKQLRTIAYLHAKEKQRARSCSLCVSNKRHQITHQIVMPNKYLAVCLPLERQVYEPHRS